LQRWGDCQSLVEQPDEFLSWWANPEEAFDHVYAYINDELHDEETRAKIEHHLSHCKSCFSRAEMERKINEGLKATQKPSPPEPMKRRLKDLIDGF
jgi:anti-sigma factor RsiW